MSVKPKTSVTVTQNGALRELFSIRERANGDLLIAIRHADHTEIEGQDVETLSQKYSVHRSPNSPGFTVKQTLSFTGNKNMTSVQFRLPGRDGLVALLFGLTVQDMSDPKYTYMPRPKDRIIKLYDDETGNGTLFYFVMILATEGNFPARTKLHTSQIVFRYFTVVVLSGFFPIPAAKGSHAVHLSTSLPRLTPGSIPPNLQNIDLASPTVQQAIDDAHALIPHLAQQLMKRWRAVVFDDGTRMEPELLDEIESFLPKFYKSPIVLPHPR